MFEYLYYKLYQASLKSSLKDIPQILAPVYFGGLIGINLSVVYLFLVKIDVLPYLITNVKQGGWLNAILIVLSIIYFREKRRNAIIEKYSKESNTKRIKGNIAVAIYVTLSLLLIFAVAFFRPGKL